MVDRRRFPSIIYIVFKSIVLICMFSNQFKQYLSYSKQISNLFDMNSIKIEFRLIKIKSDIFFRARGSENNFWN